MAIILGKRKRRVEVQPESAPKKKVIHEESEDSGDDDDAARALFQKAFEAKFQPLEKSTTPLQNESEEDEEDLGDSEDEEDGSDWSGLSGGEEEVEIVEHANPERSRGEELRLSKNKFMSSKPPTLEDEVQAPRTNVKTTSTEADGTEAANLKNDLALQRLLKESHLLNPSSFSASSDPEGKGRLKALDMRLQDLGAKTSALEQEKMPYSHRRGIKAKSASREANRRREAAENGIILERAKSTPRAQPKRDRGIGGPGVGKFRGGTLQLSSRDLRDIQKPRSGPGDRRGRGGKR
ncbi:uncharacterized protein RCC_07684 [Lecanosticta acicola]|uniref:Uncharacterized protein RCC_07684 n=1 Tax=Lecanosticta acicola TaxID=111012 RepID=A0AAI9E7R4_9PEZI|nr:uncharacterized protein RCC_07684 [Lecanosticta acicola]